jgi:uncharacterized protein YndB with AHSA1/START domain
MEVNHAAPVVASAEIAIAAPIETVWDILSDINGWPQWNPAITEAHLEGERTPGSVFRWKAGPGGITSTLRQVERPHILAWTGKTFGINAVHVYRLEDQNGATRVRTEESWEGLPARLLRGRMQKTLEDSLGAGLEALKRVAEGRSGQPS